MRPLLSDIYPEKINVGKKSYKEYLKCSKDKPLTKAITEKDRKKIEKYKLDNYSFNY